MEDVYDGDSEERLRGESQRRGSEKRFRGETQRTDSKERLLKECCPPVTKACTYQSSHAPLQHAEMQLFILLSISELTSVTAVRLKDSRLFAPSIMELYGVWYAVRRWRRDMC